MTKSDIIALLNEEIPNYPENRKNGRSEFTPKANFAVERAVLVLYQRQTADEQVTSSTSHENGIGFNGTDAFILSSFAEQIQDSTYPKGRRLSPKQMGVARRKVQKYTRQLIEVATNRTELKAHQTQAA
jgi:hypothetical protein